MGCVSKLSDIQQRVVRLRMLEELSGDVVARELGVRPDHIATLLYRAKKELFRCVTGQSPNHRLGRSRLLQQAAAKNQAPRHGRQPGNDQRDDQKPGKRKRGLSDDTVRGWPGNHGAI
jgi:Sigma-70, region 4